MLGYGLLTERIDRMGGEVVIRGIVKNPFFWMIVTQCAILPAYVYLRYHVNMWRLLIDDSDGYRIRMIFWLFVEIVGFMILEWTRRQSIKPE